MSVLWGPLWGGLRSDGQKRGTVFVQKFYKGIAGLDKPAAEAAFTDGIRCRRIFKDPQASLLSLTQELTEDNLYKHVTEYGLFGHDTVFISLTAGTRGLDEQGGMFTPYAGWARALRFATHGGRVPGVVFEGWVIVLGTPSWHIPGVAEDLRDRHAYPRFNRFWDQGEVTAKLVIPGAQISRATLVREDTTPIETIANPDAMEPSRFSNVREIVE